MQGKTVVVTGAAGGIGRALAESFGGAGGRVALLDIDASAAEAAAHQLCERGIDAMAVECDVTSETACRDAMAAVREAYGKIEILINNAGITHLGRMIDTNVDVYRKVFDINLFGALHCTKAALPDLVERGGLVIVISSVAGFAPLSGRSGYSASKHALHGLFDTLRAELIGTDTDVMVVCPGFTDTDIEAHALGDAKRTMVGKVAKPEDVAAAVLKGAMRRRRLLVLSTVGRLSYILSRIAPAAYERMMARRMALSHHTE